MRTWRTSLPTLSLFLLTAIPACDSSTTDVEAVEVSMVDRTAVFDRVLVEFTRGNYSWAPRDGLAPAFSERFVTIELNVRGLAIEKRSIGPDAFRLRTWDGTRPYDPANTEIWKAGSTGRTPIFETMDLANAEGGRVWLTFTVPRGRAHLVEALLWSPEPRVTLAFPLPSSSRTLVCGLADIFGRVTGPDGRPVVGARVEVATYNLRFEENRLESGRCVGEPSLDEIETDAEGRYVRRVVSRFCDELCVTATATGPDGSGLGESEVTGGTLIPFSTHPLVEPSQLRIDVVLPRGISAID